MKGLCAALLALVAAVVTMALGETPAHADQPGRIIAVTTTLKPEPRKGETASFVVTPGVARLTATVDEEVASVSAGSCPGTAGAATASIPVNTATDGAPVLVNMCVTGKKR